MTTVATRAVLRAIALPTGLECISTSSARICCRYNARAGCGVNSREWQGRDADANARDSSVGGASCGVTQAANVATRQKDVTALVMLSGPASDAGNAYIARTPSLAVFGA